MLVVEEAMRRRAHLTSATAALARDWMSNSTPTTSLLHSPVPPRRELPETDQPIDNARVAEQRPLHGGDV